MRGAIESLNELQILTAVPLRIPSEMNQDLEISNQKAILDFEFDEMSLSEFLKDALEDLGLFIEKTHVKESLSDFLTADIEDLQMTLDLESDEVKQIEVKAQPMLSYTQKVPEFEIDFDFSFDFENGI